MDFVIGLAVGAAALVAVSAAVSFACDEMTEKEIQRQNRMQDEYDEYEKKRVKDYEVTRAHYTTLLSNVHASHQSTVHNYHVDLLEQRKKGFLKFYKSRCKMLETQYKEKQALLKECKAILALCENGLKKQQNTYLRFKSIKSTMISLQEASYKLEAYLEYLDKYKDNLRKTYEQTGLIVEPFSFTLPEDYPYEGQLIYLNPGDFRKGQNGYGYTFAQIGYVKLDKADESVFEEHKGTESLPFVMFVSKKGTKYLSYTRGVLKNSIGGTIGIDTQVKEIKPKYLVLSFMGNEYLRLTISRDALINQRRKTPIGSSLHVFVTDYDYALEGLIRVSEKMEEGLNIAKFDQIAMVMSEDERRELFQFLKDNNLLEEDDEWRIAPIWGADRKIEGVIMQKGTAYAYRAGFEELENKKTVLRYQGMLEREQFVSFDDVFVSANVTVVAYSPKQLVENSEKYTDLYEETLKLQMYLISEFITQNKMIQKSPMSVYLSQWQEVTNRLIEVLSVGRKFALNVEEFDTLRILGETRTILYVSEEEKLRKFYEKELQRKRYFFYIQYTEYERINCTIRVSDDSCTVEVQGEIGAEDLLARDFVLELYSVANPYAEKQHVFALDSFREGRVVSEKIKTAILDISGEEFCDNGNQITEFYNDAIGRNEAQADAVMRAFAEERFFMIQGPPGTGKTTVIKELILQQLNTDPKARILVVSQANVAVDNVLRGIVEIIRKTHALEENQIVRCGAGDKISGDLEVFSFDAKMSAYQQEIRSLTSEDEEVLRLQKEWMGVIDNSANAEIVGECLLGCFQIIGATCVGLENRHYGLSGMEFDLVIIDEAGKALPGELLIPINRAKKVIIIGDHKQLPPVINPALFRGGEIEYDDVVEEENQVDFLNRSFFQRLYEDCPDTMKGMLRTQFRMPPVIADLVNMFYDGELITGENCFQKKPILLDNHLIFVDMKKDEKYREQQDIYDDGRKGSPYNPEEVEAVKRIVAKIRKVYDGRIVVITPYKKQKYLLAQAMTDKNVWVNTIDAFQGDEEDVVIFCTTRAKQPTRYFSDNARLNVAFSRARNTLIIVGDSEYFRRYDKDHILHRVSDYIDKNGRIIEYQLDESGADMAY